MSSGLRILAIALIGAQHQPLFLRSFAHATNRADPDLKWYLAAHTSLDVFDEREPSMSKAQDGYLGLLYTMDDHAVYGYTTNTRVRIVLILGLTDLVVRDIDIKAVR